MAEPGRRRSDSAAALGTRTFANNHARSSATLVGRASATAFQLDCTRVSLGRSAAFFSFPNWLGRDACAWLGRPKPKHMDTAIDNNCRNTCDTDRVVEICPPPTTAH